MLIRANGIFPDVDDGGGDNDEFKHRNSLILNINRNDVVILGLGRGVLDDVTLFIVGVRVNWCRLARRVGVSPGNRVHLDIGASLWARRVKIKKHGDSSVVALSESYI